MTNLKSAISSFGNLIIHNKPYYAYFYVTNRCNLSCRMCFTANYVSQEKRLETFEIEILANNLKKIGVKIVSLTGGEPLMREDLVSIIRIFSEKGLAVHLQTNGFDVSSKRLKEVIDAGCSAIAVSLASLDPQKQDYICGQNGAWQDIMKTLSCITAESPKRGFLRTITTVVSRHNLEELPDLVAFATKIGFYIFLLPFHIPNFQKGERPKHFFTGSETSTWMIKPNDFGLVDSIYQKLLKMKKNGSNIYVSSRFLRESIEFLKYGNVLWKNKYLSCAFPNSIFFITVDGHFHVCGFEKFNDVSLLNPDFPKIFYSKKFQERTQGVARQCKGCMCAMAETSLLRRDISVLYEKIVINIKLNCMNRRVLSYEGILKIINNISNV